jgi:hypothetical protein
MKISKVLIAAMFAAGFVSVPTTLVMADTREQDDLMVVQCLNEYTEEEGYNCIDTTPEEGVAYTTGEGDVDVKPIDSCWTTEDGLDVCARGGMVPTPATLEDTPVDSDCSVTTDDQGVSSEVCLKAVPYSTTPEEDDSVAYLEDGPVDDTLMFQSGEAKTLATPADPTVSNAVAIFAVLAGALWALVIVMNRRKEAK